MNYFELMQELDKVANQIEKGEETTTEGGVQTLLWNARNAVKALCGQVEGEMKRGNRIQEGYNEIQKELRTANHMLDEEGKVNDRYGRMIDYLLENI